MQNFISMLVRAEVGFGFDKAKDMFVVDVYGTPQEGAETSSSDLACQFRFDKYGELRGVVKNPLALIEGLT